MSQGVNWRLRSKCSRLTLEESDKLFFAKGRTSKKAKAFCSDCPVILECLEKALEEDTTCGIWGGLSQAQRKKILDQRKPLAPLPGSVGVVKRVNLIFT